MAMDAEERKLFEQWREINEGLSGMQYSREESKLNSIILALTGAMLSLLVGIGLWQLERIISKMDDFAYRITRIEMKIGLER